MIVCSCNVLTDHDVRATLSASGAPRTTGEVYHCLGCSAQCGRCARTIRRIMNEALAAAEPACCRDARVLTIPVLTTQIARRTDVRACSRHYAAIIVAAARACAQAHAGCGINRTQEHDHEEASPESSITSTRRCGTS